MNPTLEHYAALFTLVIMPSLLVLSHGMLSVAKAAAEYAHKTKSTRDDAVTERILNVATWVNVIVRALAHVATAGVLARATAGDDETETPTPHLEAVQAEDVENEDPRGEP